MCELFGYSGASPRKLSHELREFFSHSEQHPNGWGLAVLNGSGISMERQPRRASESQYLSDRLRSDVVSSHVLAHIRLATIGANRYDNCHPFTGVDAEGRQWTLIHNGTIFEHPILDRYSAVQKGTTDSERVFLFLIDSINQAIEAAGRSLTDEERFKVVDDVVLTFNKYNKVNLLIFDGDLLYAHTNCADTLHVCQQEDGVLFSTEPLGLGAWEKAPFLQLVAYRNGRIAFEGTRHDHQYFLDQERLDQVLEAYRYL